MSCGRVGSRKAKGKGHHRGISRSTSRLHFFQTREGLSAKRIHLAVQDDPV